MAQPENLPVQTIAATLRAHGVNYQQEGAGTKAVTQSPMDVDASRLYFTAAEKERDPVKATTQLLYAYQTELEELRILKEYRQKNKIPEPEILTASSYDQKYNIAHKVLLERTKQAIRKKQSGLSEADAHKAVYSEIYGSPDATEEERQARYKALQEKEKSIVLELFPPNIPQDAAKKNVDAWITANKSADFDAYFERLMEMTENPALLGDIRGDRFGAFTGDNKNQNTMEAARLWTAIRSKSPSVLTAEIAAIESRLSKNAGEGAGQKALYDLILRTPIPDRRGVTHDMLEEAIRQTNPQGFIALAGIIKKISPEALGDPKYLEAAINRASPEIVSYLIDNAGPINLKMDTLDEKGETFLMRAVKAYDYESSIEKPNGTEPDKTPYQRVLEALLQAKPDMTVRNARGESALDMAIALGKDAAIGPLVNAGADINAWTPATESIDSEGIKSKRPSHNPLFSALNRGNMKLATQLVEKHNAKVDSHDPQGDTILTHILEEDRKRGFYGENIEAVRFLVKHGADVNLPGAYSQTPLEIVMPKPVYEHMPEVPNVALYLLSRSGTPNPTIVFDMPTEDRDEFEKKKQQELSQKTNHDQWVKYNKISIGVALEPEFENADDKVIDAVVRARLAAQNIEFKLNPSDIASFDEINSRSVPTKKETKLLSKAVLESGDTRAIAYFYAKNLISNDELKKASRRNDDGTSTPYTQKDLQRSITDLINDDIITSQEAFSRGFAVPPPKAPEAAPTPPASKRPGGQTR